LLSDDGYLLTETCKGIYTYKYILITLDGVIKIILKIDHILIDMRRHASALDVQSFRGEDCDTDHYLMVAKVRGRLVVIKQTKHRFHMERFNLK
jgi:hypothetical protein